MLTELEKEIMVMLLDGEDEVLANLRKQLKSVIVTEREMTGVGFFTTFQIPSTIPRITNKSFKFGDVYAHISDLDYGAGFLLYVKDGALEMLEAYTYEEPWPEHISEFDLNYINGRRDLITLKTKWGGI